MRAAVLIAANFVREQRWVVILLLFWVVGSGLLSGVVGDRISEDDLLFFLKQQAIYGVSIGSFLAATAVHNERRSRRILAVLSKAVSRSEYLAGLLLAVVAILAAYCLIMGVIGAWVLIRAGLPPASLWFFVIATFATALLTASLTLLFSTVLPPVVALAATAILVSLPAAVAAFAGPAVLHVLPAYSLISQMFRFSLHATWTPNWSLVAIAFGEAILAWLIASLIFSRRDVAVAVE